MNRRNFIGNLLAIGAGFAVLPGAGRIWRPERSAVIPEWLGLWDNYYLSAYHNGVDRPPAAPRPEQLLTWNGKTWYGVPFIKDGWQPWKVISADDACVPAVEWMALEPRRQNKAEYHHNTIFANLREMAR